MRITADTAILVRVPRELVQQAVGLSREEGEHSRFGPMLSKVASQHVFPLRHAAIPGQKRGVAGDRLVKRAKPAFWQSCATLMARFQDPVRNDSI